MKNNLKSLKSIQQKKTQSVTEPLDSGRSMIEMLGVLAIIGVLSIAGIMGYTYATNKYQANKIAHELNLLSNQIALIMNQPRESDFELSLRNPYDNEDGGKLTSGGYNFVYGCGDGSTSDDFCYTDDTSYYMEVSGISKKVCQSLTPLTQHIPYVTEQKIISTDDPTGTSCGENNALVLFFIMQDDHLDEGVKTSNSEETKKSTEVTEPVDASVQTSTPITTFTSESECGYGSFKGTDGQCYSCNYSYEQQSGYTTPPEATEKECNSCTTSYKRTIAFANRCFSCDDAFISDRIDNDPADIIATYKKCGRGVDYTKASYLQCSSGAKDKTTCTDDERTGTNNVCYSCNVRIPTFSWNQRKINSICSQCNLSVVTEGSYWVCK